MHVAPTPRKCRRGAGSRQGGADLSKQRVLALCSLLLSKGWERFHREQVPSEAEPRSSVPKEICEIPDPVPLSAWLGLGWCRSLCW